MSRKPDMFESRQPDFPSRDSRGMGIKKNGALGALENSEVLGFSGEKLNQITDEMIKSVAIKDTGRRWYVEYKEYNPTTEAFERRREYGYVNREKDPQKRRDLITALYNEIVTGMGARVSLEAQSEDAIKSYIDTYQRDIAGSLAPRTISDIKGTLKKFYAFIRASRLQNYSLNQIDKEHMLAFRVHRSKKACNNTVNKEFATVKTFFNHFKNNYKKIIQVNPGEGLKKLQAKPESHIAFTDKMVQDIQAHLKATDPVLLLYCQVIGLGFLRCREARLMKVGDIDFHAKTLTLWARDAKTGIRDVKPMLLRFYDILIDAGIQNYPSDHYVFSYGGRPGKKMVHEGFFRKRFKKVKKKFKLDSKYTIYGFRHTTVSKMIENNAPWREIMKYTGHSTMAAFEKYARSLGNKPARDLSDYV